MCVLCDNPWSPMDQHTYLDTLWQIVAIKGPCSSVCLYCYHWLAHLKISMACWESAFASKRNISFSTKWAAEAMFFFMFSQIQPWEMLKNRALPCCSYDHSAETRSLRTPEFLGTLADVGEGRCFTPEIPCISGCSARKCSWSPNGNSYPPILSILTVT